MNRLLFYVALSLHLFFVGGVLNQAFAQNVNLRQSVCIVRADIDSTTASNLMSYSLWLSRNGDRDASRGIASLAKGGFGSGVVIEKDGELYVLTNSHVVGIGKTVKLVFEKGFETSDYRKISVVYQDDKADIAVLKLPDYGGKLTALTFSENALNDGDEVWSAGFPGLSGNPSWQIGQGIVSNVCLRVPNNDYTYIQHTAQVDRGSSGGPLLVKTVDGYEVVGMNTMKVFDRESVNLAIPVATIRQALDKMSNDDNYISPVQSHLLAIDTLDVNDYGRLYDRMPDSVLRHQKELFEQGYYLEGMAVVVDYAAENSIAKRDKRKTTRIKAAVPRSNKSGIDRDYGFFYKLAIESSIWDFNIGGSTYLSVNNMLGIQYFIGGISLGYVHLKNSPVDNSDEPGQYGWYYVDDGEHINGFLGQLQLGAQVPFALRRVELVPYILPSVGLGASRSIGYMYAAYGFKVGLDVEFPADKDVAFVAGLGYSFKRFNFCGEYFDGYDKKNTHGLNISIGVKF